MAGSLKMSMETRAGNDRSFAISSCLPPNIEPGCAPINRKGLVAKKLPQKERSAGCDAQLLSVQPEIVLLRVPSSAVFNTVCSR